MNTTPPMLAQVRAHVARFAPSSPDPADIAPDAELVADLGFDSVRLVELLLVLDETHGVSLPVQDMLAGTSLSVGALAEQLARALDAVR